MASFAAQRCSVTRVGQPRMTACTQVAPRVARRTTHTTVVRSGLGDGGLNERKAVLHSFYHEFHDTQKLTSLMADDFTMAEDGGSKTYSKQDYLGIFGAVLKAVPDFKWGAATNGETDRDGFAIVTVTATGHHTGAPLQLPGLEPVPASGKHFCLAEEVQKVKVKGDKVQEIVVLPTKGAGPRALYAVLSGKVPASSSGAVAY